MPTQAEDAYPPAATPTTSVTTPPRHTTSWTRFADGVVTCETGPDSEQCYDTFLDLAFEYPSFLGKVSGAGLSKGDWSGVAYGYEMNGSWVDGIGGRSRDYSAGPDSVWTDLRGFCDQTVDDYCSPQESSQCEVVGPGVVAKVIFPASGDFCETYHYFGVSPEMIVAVDLPRHPVINGFGFAAALLPPEVEVMSAPTEDQCSEAAQAEFDRAMQDLREALPAGTAAPEIQARYDAMVQLAESIEGYYVEDFADLHVAPSEASGD